MAQAVSNLTRFVSFAPVKASKKLDRRISIKAMAAGNNRDNLDHLQRSIRKEHQTTPPQKNHQRVSPVAPIGLWDRFPTARTVQQMMETMERIMEDPFSSEGGAYSSYSRGMGRTPWEIKEGENEYKMRFDMPGMRKEDVKVWVEEKMMVVKAEKGGEEEEEGEWSAKSYGRYSSRIALPENVELEKIRAEVKDGVLYIRIPKESLKSKIMNINVH